MQKHSKRLPDPSICNEIIHIIETSASPLTPSALEKIISAKYQLEKHQIRLLVKRLIAQGELEYANKFGSTYLEISFNKPVRVSTYVVLKPPGYPYQAQPGDAVIQIKPGASFGDGRHPTTRLAIRGIEYVLKKFEFDDSRHHPNVLDIGTGTGILALTAVGLGIHNGIGIDIDPCARSEAKENVLLNNFEGQIDISDQYLEAIDQSFLLVTANLRLPTLIKICPCMRRITTPKGFIILSGIRSHESADLVKIYSRKNFEIQWKQKELDWMGIVFRRFD